MKNRRLKHYILKDPKLAPIIEQLRLAETGKANRKKTGHCILYSFASVKSDGGLGHPDGGAVRPPTLSIARLLYSIDSLFESIPDYKDQPIDVIVFLSDSTLANISVQNKSLKTLQEKWGNQLKIEYFTWPVDELGKNPAKQKLQLAHKYKSIDTALKYGYDNVLFVDLDTRFAINSKKGNVINLMNNFAASGDQVWGGVAGHFHPVKAYFDHFNIQPKGKVKRWNAGQMLFRGIYTPEYPFRTAYKIGKEKEYGRGFWEMMINFYDLLFDNNDLKHIYESGPRDAWICPVWFVEELILSVVFHTFSQKLSQFSEGELALSNNSGWWWGGRADGLEEVSSPEECPYKTKAPIIHHYYTGATLHDPNHIPPTYWPPMLVDRYKEVMGNNNYISWEKICCPYCGWDHNTKKRPYLIDNKVLPVYKGWYKQDLTKSKKGEVVSTYCGSDENAEGYVNLYHEKYFTPYIPQKWAHS